MNLIPNSGWTLEVSEAEWEEMKECVECGSPVVEKNGFYCKRVGRMLHRNCEEKSSHKKCRGGEIHHEHFNIIHIKIPKEK